MCIYTRIQMNVNPSAMDQIAILLFFKNDFGN